MKSFGDDIISIRKRSSTFTIAIVMLYTTALSLSAGLSSGNSVDGEAIIETTAVCESATTTSTTPASSLTSTNGSIRTTVPTTTTAVSETTTVPDTSSTTQSQTTRTAIQTTKLTTSQTTASSTTTSSTTTTEKSELTVDMTDSESQSESTTTTTTTSTPSLTFLGNFRGTYYRGSTNPCRGGSGRTLIDCAAGAMTVKGSVACKYIYANYGYYVNDRTMVYIEVPSYPSMTGWYYVDDCCASYSVVDFYYPNYNRCPFQNAGVISVKVYI